MKNFKVFFLGIALTAALGACGGGHSHDNDHHGSSTMDSTHTHAHGHGMEFSSAYVCPMHCQGSGGDQAGTCPVCGMDYMKLEEHVKDGHRHSENR